MGARVDASWERAELRHVIRGVRRRWRTKLLLRGLTSVAAGTIVALLAAAIVADRAGFTPDTLLGLRVALAVAFAAAVVWFVMLPFRRRVSDERVALYLEEHEPSLDAALVSALDARESPAISPALLRRTIETAVERCASIDDGRGIESRSVRRSMAALAGIGLVVVALGSFGPESLRKAAGRVLSPAPGAAATEPIAIDVLPGDTTVARGADQVVTARLQGFATDRAELILRSVADSSVQRLPMAAGQEPGSYGLLLFDLEGDTEYFVEADGVRSAVYRLTVAELPYAERIELEYRYPAYSGLLPQTVEDGGDIAALEGTTVRLRVHPTLPVPGGRIVLDDGRAAPLAAAEDGVLTASLRVERQGFYHVEFAGADSRTVVGSPEYIIDVLDDAPPVVSFAEPGRDATATSVEELYVEAEAADDFGVAGVELIFSVNGGPEQVIELFRGSETMREVSAGHTFYLEELGLQPGDFVAYHARATDNDAVGGAKSATSDLYFIEIRPFGREYRQAEQAAAAGGGGGGAGADRGLSERQRRIIAATFNIARDSAEYPADELLENLATVRLAQEALRDEARALAQRMVMRGVTADSSFAAIADLLPRAADEMDVAIERLDGTRPTDALQPEQRALVHLQRAEAVFREVMVGMGAQGGGGGMDGASAEELADLFELDTDELRNPYETLQRGAPDTVSQQLDETAARLEELARRQERQSEWLRNRAAARASGQPAPASGGSAGGQRELAEQVEEEARRLERLSRETARPELMETARQLREAADAMRRAAANGASGMADANAARERLEDARRLLERSREAATERDARDALRQLDRIAREQGALSRDMRELAGTRPSGARAERADSLRSRIANQADAVADLQRELHRLAAEARGEQNEAARRLDEAAGLIRDSQLERKIRFMERLTPPGVPPEYLGEVDAEIAGDLRELRRRLDRAAEAFEDAAPDPTAETLERAEDLARGVTSLGERMRNASDSGRLTGGSGQAGGMARQFRGEAGERLEDAEELRRRLGRAGRDVEEIDRVMSGLRRLTDPAVYDDPVELERLRTALTESVQRLEYALREELAREESARLFLSGSGEVPDGFRQMVEEYYRTLAEERRRGIEEGSR